MDSMARGLLMLSPRLMPRLIPLSSIDLLDTLATLPTVFVPMDTLPTLPMDSMARGLLMLSPRLIPLSSIDLRTYGYPAYSTYGLYGKRSADAEPEADPALLYRSSYLWIPCLLYLWTLWQEVC